ncbi:periplasmic-type flagellar collar protein FlbB [Alkalispirochaeta sphaeroplastigenens]|nr:flagellar protein FlbB [Alkalispirochaeta sphaeroplastigenens]
MAARYSRMGALPQILLLMLLVLGLTVGGLLWFDYLGLIDTRDSFAPLLRLVGRETRQVFDEPDDIMLMDRLRLEAFQEALRLQAEELSLQRDRLASYEQDLEKREQELAAAEKEMEEREVSLNERLRAYENRRAVLEQNSRYLTSMRPAEAVEILKGYDDQLMIETFRVTEELAARAGQMSLVSVWLSSLPPERAADIQRKMTLRPDE